MKTTGLRALPGARRFWATFFLIAALATATTIFCFSAQEQQSSSDASDPITEKVAKAVKTRKQRKKLSTDERRAYMEAVSVVVRKSAHFGEYALLGFNLAAWLRLRRERADARRTALVAWGLGTLYGCSDELHQLFVKGRACSLIDMGIDSAGALGGALLAALALSLLALRRGAFAP